MVSLCLADLTLDEQHTPDSLLDGVRLIYGPNAVMVPASGMTVGESRTVYRDILSVPDSTEAYLNGEQVNDSTPTTAGDRLEFVRSNGEKGAGSRGKSRFKWFKDVVPLKITEEILRFCEEISPGQNPLFVDLSPQPDAKVYCCHTNVPQHIQRRSGEQIFGWSIWQSQIELHAIFHSVWKSQQGTLVDITPTEEGERHVLFLPDPTRRWLGATVPSRRKARIDHPHIHRLCALFAENEKIDLSLKDAPLNAAFGHLRQVHILDEIAGLLVKVDQMLTRDPDRERLDRAKQRKRKKEERQRRKKGRRK